VLEEGATLTRRGREALSTLTILQPSTSLRDPREQRAFHFFLSEAAPVMSGVFDTGFWTRLVPQVSHVEPAVQKALFTIGQLFDTPLNPGDMKNKIALKDVPATQKMAYTWYSYAVAELQQAVSRGTQSIPMALLSCVLVVCVEYQLNNASCALLLLQKGIKLLEIALDAAQHLPFDSASSAILELIVPFFSRHAMIGATFGFPPPAEWRIDAVTFRDLDGIRSSTETLDGARVSLYSLMYQGNAFVRVTWLLDLHPVPASSVIAGQRQMASRVDAWRENYLTLFCESAQGPVDISSDSMLTHYLLMYHSVLKVWIATCTSTFQTAFDDHFASFEDILVRAETVIRTSRHDTEQRSPFAAEMGVVSPLFFVTTKCRHPVLRRRALALLESMPQLEGIYKILPTIKVLRKIIEVEEEAMGSRPLTRNATSSPAEGAIGSTSSTATPTALPEEANRIHHVEVLLNATTKTMTNASIRVLRVVCNANDQRQMREDVVALEPASMQSRTSATRAIPICPTTAPLLDNRYGGVSIQ
jgi:hypothetical protein